MTGHPDNTVTVDTTNYEFLHCPRCHRALPDGFFWMPDSDNHPTVEAASCEFCGADTEFSCRFCPDDKTCKLEEECDGCSFSYRDFEEAVAGPGEKK